MLVFEKCGRYETWKEKADFLHPIFYLVRVSLLYFILFRFLFFSTSHLLCGGHRGERETNKGGKNSEDMKHTCKEYAQTVFQFFK